MHAIWICPKLHKDDKVSFQNLKKRWACKLNNWETLITFSKPSLLGDLVKKPSLGKKSAPLKNCFNLKHLKLFELIANYNALTVIKLEEGASRRNPLTPDQGLGVGSISV